MLIRARLQRLAGGARAVEHTVCCMRYVADCTEGASTSCQMDVHGATQETLGLIRAAMTLFDTHTSASDPERQSDCHFKWFCLLSQQ